MKNMVYEINTMSLLFDSELKDLLCSTRHNEFIPFQMVKETHDAFLTDSTLEYNYNNYCGNFEKRSWVLSVLIRKDRSVRIMFLDNDINTPNVVMNTNIDATEEELFQSSTVSETFGITLKEIDLFNRIWGEYFE